MPTLAPQQSLCTPKSELEPRENGRWGKEAGTARGRRSSQSSSVSMSREEGKKPPEQTGGSQELSLLSLTFPDAVSGSDSSRAS